MFFSYRFIPIPVPSYPSNKQSLSFASQHALQPPRPSRLQTVIWLGVSKSGSPTCGEWYNSCRFLGRVLVDGVLKKTGSQSKKCSFQGGTLRFKMGMIQNCATSGIMNPQICILSSVRSIPKWVSMSKKGGSKQLTRGLGMVTQDRVGVGGDNSACKLNMNSVWEIYGSLGSSNRIIFHLGTSPLTTSLGNKTRDVYPTLTWGSMKTTQQLGTSTSTPAKESGRRNKQKP